jgi:hypothetical protein
MPVRTADGHECEDLAVRLERDDLGLGRYGDGQGGRE